MIDLHIHSTASDGSFTPFEILTLAQQAGVKAISITDHDTIDGTREIIKNPLPEYPEVVSGVEISCAPPPGFEHIGSVHLLGYGFSIYDKQLKAVLDNAKKARAERNPKIIEKLNRLGFKISMEQVQNRYGADQTGRPHIAQFMVEKGYVPSFSKAFDQYLGKGKPGYVDKYKISCEQAIKIIHQAGGIPVLAHPGLLTFNKTGQFDAFIGSLIEYGLEGIEVFYTDHDASLTAFYQEFAKKKKLIITGGSDFHGTFNAGVNLGTGKGDLHAGPALFKTLIEQLKKKGKRGSDLTILEENIGYSFKDKALLENALCHRSYLNENQKTCSDDNERLEFLGDAVLDLCIARLLMEEHPARREGELSKLRSILVSEPGLADTARKIDLGRFVKLGKGEYRSGGQEKNSILSDAFEAVIAAVFLDSDFNIVYDLVETLFKESISTRLSKHKIVDYKSHLQEYAQEHGHTPPQYQINREVGPDHDKTFEVSLQLFNIQATGFGKTKKAAEQEVARKALNLIKQERT